MSKQAMCWVSSILAMLAALDAHAVVANTLFRTYLSVDGSDSNPCTVSAPCRLLPQALLSTQSGGEVWILDSANYNVSTVSIDQSVSILAIPGALGSLVANGNDAVDIVSANTATVTFRNIGFREIDKQSAYNGISASDPHASIIVTNSEFANFAYAFNASAWQQINIEDSAFYSNVDAIAIGGTTPAPSSGATASVIIAACRVEQNTSTGIYIADAAASLSRNSVSNNLIGIGFDSGSNVVLDNNFVTGNGSGVLSVASSTVGYAFSSGTNTILNNKNNVVGTITQAALQ